MHLNLRQRLVKALARILKVDYYDNPTILDDDPSAVYVWLVDDPKESQEFADYVDHAFIRHKGHSPQAMHVVVSDVEEIKRIDKQIFEQKIKPWIKANGG